MFIYFVASLIVIFSYFLGNSLYSSRIHSSADEISSINRSPSELSSSDESFSRTDFSRDEEGESPRLGFCVLNFLSILSGFLSREKLTQKWQKSKVEQFSKLQFLNDKIDQNTNFSQLSNAKRLFLNNLQVTYNCSAFGVFSCVSFSRERKFERIERKIYNTKSDP